MTTTTQEFGGSRTSGQHYGQKSCRCCGIMASARISVQPADIKQRDADLIGKHTVKQTKAFFLARTLGFDNINMDLIVGASEDGGGGRAYVREITAPSRTALRSTFLAVESVRRGCQFIPKHHSRDARFTAKWLCAIPDRNAVVSHRCIPTMNHIVLSRHQRLTSGVFSDRELSGSSEQIVCGI